MVDKDFQWGLLQFIRGIKNERKNEKKRRKSVPYDMLFSSFIYAPISCNVQSLTFFTK